TSEYGVADSRRRAPCSALQAVINGALHLRVMLQADLHVAVELGPQEGHDEAPVAAQIGRGALFQRVPAREGPLDLGVPAERPHAVALQVAHGARGLLRG